jgi:hypothetical protein
MRKATHFVVLGHILLTKSTLDGSKFNYGYECISMRAASSVFALYIEHFAYYCGFYFMPFKLSNSNFGYIEEGESTAGYTFPPVWDLLLALA